MLGNGNGKNTGKRRFARIFLTGVITGALLLHPAVGGLAWQTSASAGGIAGAASVTDNQPHLQMTGESMITSGAVRRTYNFISQHNGAEQTAKVHVIAIDLANPYVSVNAMMGGSGGTLPGRSSVGSMVKETGAVAGVNADFFDMSSSEPVPFGAHIADGELAKTPRRLQGMYMFGITKERVPVIDRFTVEGAVTAASGAAFPLSGVNEASYRTEPDGAYSHANALYLYTDSWTAEERPNSKVSGTTPTEVLVRNGIVVQIADMSTLPMQPPADGYILRAHGQAAQFVRDHLQPGTAVAVDYKLIAADSGLTYAPEDWQMMVGGHTILVDGGVPASYSRNVSSLSPSSDRARTAVGYSQDKKTVYLVTVERSGSSAGATLQEMQQILVLLGAWQGINLDGGGSTTMISRPLGDFETRLAHPTEDGGAGTYQRPVVNGIGVYTHAPQGALRGIAASGKQVLFIGEQTSYGLKAYDEYYNPLDPAGISAQWTLDKPELGSLSGNVFLASRPGTGTLTVKAGKLAEQLPIEIIGEQQIVRLSIEASSSELTPGAVIRVPVSAELADGRKLSVPAGSVNWEFRGFQGAVQGDTIRIDHVKPGVDIGYAIARYDGYSALLTLTAGSSERMFEDFENIAYAITSTTVPGDVAASAELIFGVPGREYSRALMLRYDFAASTEDRTKAAYAVFGGGQGVPLPGQPTGLSVDVFGDASGNMVRAMVTDASGKDHLVDLAPSVDWFGWKTLNADLTAYPIVYPAALKRLYVASPREGQADRAASGEIMFDDVKLHYPAEPTQAKSETVVLTLGSKQAVVGTEPVTLDVAPVAKDGVTYLPLRFVADALGGSADWEGHTKKVTVLRGDRLLELRFGHETIIVNGERKAAAAQPIAENGRTLVPVRLVSEQLGLRVDWDGKTRTVTIR